MPSKILILILGIISMFIFTFVIWRLFSRRISLPCPSWLAWLVKLDNPFSKINQATTIIEHLELEPGMEILDAGCGPGRLTIPLARKTGPTGKVEAMDIQANMLKRTEKKALDAELQNITFLHAELGKGKLKLNKFDRALLVNVLGEISHQEIVLQEIFDALKPGGILSITEIIFDPHYQRLNRVLNLAQKIGFRKKNLLSDWVAYNLLLEKPRIQK